MHNVKIYICNWVKILPKKSWIELFLGKILTWKILNFVSFFFQNELFTFFGYEVINFSFGNALIAYHLL